MGEKKFFSLLRQSNELKKNKNSLDPEASDMLLDFLVTIENNLHFSIEILKDAIKSYPNDYEYFIWIGEMYITLKEFDKGKSYLKTAEELDCGSEF